LHYLIFDIFILPQNLIEFYHAVIDLLLFFD
jgi:hypothetical protein